ncbi:hypothetical protein B6I21_00935 [candidate division KSB1 bacterium 4572_119]|nr:MAG: hypothetical protein B6I21_00935 [candidate division KSB1 bacterium 4572_119]
MVDKEKINILLVDDKPKNLIALEGVLDNPRLNLVKANSGREALSLILDYDFALVLLDVQMPDMDGFETAELMRGIEKTKHIPIIFVTAINKDQKYVFKGYEAGAVDYMFKPVDPEILNSKVNVFIDLFQQKRTIKNQSLELEHKITELNGAFLELQKKEKLLKSQAEEMAAINQDLKEFAYIVSHDLKAPLRAISSLVDWLACDYKDKFNEKGKELLNLLLGRVKRMHDLIEGILRYSRVGRVKEEKVNIDLNLLVPDVIELVDVPDNIEVKIKGDFPKLVAEKTRIEQVFQNLISNAIKYMDKPKGLIQIACKKKEDFWEFSIADNGPGIEEKHFKKIFQIFQTLAPRDEIESTGVGLSLVKKIVEMYGGKVWVESEVTKGSTFFFTVPKLT